LSRHLYYTCHYTGNGINEEGNTPLETFFHKNSDEFTCDVTEFPRDNILALEALHFRQWKELILEYSYLPSLPPIDRFKVCEKTDEFLYHSLLEIYVQIIRRQISLKYNMKNRYAKITASNLDASLLQKTVPYMDNAGIITTNWDSALLDHFKNNILQLHGLHSSPLSLILPTETTWEHGFGSG
jgi:hypothetical protein